MAGLRFRQGDTLGSHVAEQDQFLDACFIVNEAFVAAADTDDPRGVLLGRSGSGKSAIIERLKARHPQEVVEVRPQDLALHFLGGSELLQALRATHVNLDLFYKLVWRHVLVVEVLKKLHPGEGNATVGAVIRRLTRRKTADDKARETAANYLEEWRASFFATGEHRVQELHETLAKNLCAKLGISPSPSPPSWLSLFGISGEASFERRSASEVKTTIETAQQVVSEIQIAHLQTLVKLVDEEVAKTSTGRLYVLIDDLDQSWVESDLADDLIRALMNEIYELRSRMRSVKIVAAIRDSILHKAERKPKRGYQSVEKLSSQRLRIIWTADDLRHLVNLRMGELARRRNQSFAPSTVFPPPRRGNRHSSALDYIVGRCAGRPRDVIYWLNLVIRDSVGKSSITLRAVNESEVEYSRWRVRAVEQEWAENYPNVLLLLRLLRDRTQRFLITEWDASIVLDIIGDPLVASAPWCKAIAELFESSRSEEAFLSEARRRFASILYEVGLIGLIVDGSNNPLMAYQDDPVLDPEQIPDEALVVPHPATWMTLGIR